MQKLTITKEFRFEGAHALLGYNGKCRHIHGHSYKLLVTVTGNPITDLDCPKNGMIMDFSDLKSIVEELIIRPFDHALLLRKDAPLAEALSEAYQNVRILDFQPTCEQLTLYIASTLQAAIIEPNKLEAIRLYETPTSFAEWRNA